MKFGAVVSSLLVAATLASAAPTELERRQDQSVDCLENLKLLGGYQLYCEKLATDCIYNKSNGTALLWSHPTCVAAATCAGARNIYIAANCTNPAIPDSGPQVPSLDYNLYANIVGACAWAPGGCPITQQNYIDFFYGSLTSVNNTVWPQSVNEVIAFFSTIEAWTKTGNTIPYLNFNDWLHYSF